MAITSNINIDSIRAQYNTFLDAVQKAQIEQLRRLGEKCLINARENKGYMMKTGALLSSTGYTIYVDGVAVHSHFDAASGAQSSAAAQGIKKGQRVADAVGKETTGVALVVVAGEDYAAHVEARGYVVLSSAKNYAERELPNKLAKLIENIKRAAE